MHGQLSVELHPVLVVAGDDECSLAGIAYTFGDPLRDHAVAGDHSKDPTCRRGSEHRQAERCRRLHRLSDVSRPIGADDRPRVRVGRRGVAPASGAGRIE